MWNVVGFFPSSKIPHWWIQLEVRGHIRTSCRSGTQTEPELLESTLFHPKVIYELGFKSKNREMRPILFQSYIRKICISDLYKNILNARVQVQDINFLAPTPRSSWQWHNAMTDLHRKDQGIKVVPRQDYVRGIKESQREAADSPVRCGKVQSLRKEIKHFWIPGAGGTGSLK